MQVANPSIRCFRDFFAIVIDPIKIDQVLFIRDRPVRDRPRALQRRSLVERELDRMVGFVSQQTIRIIVRLQLFTIDRQHVVADTRIHANFRQWRAINVFGVIALEYLRDAITSRLLVKLEPCPRQTRTRSRRILEITPIDVCVLNRQLSDHLANNVVEIRPMGHILQQRFVLLAQRDPVVAVHVRNVEPVAIASPNLIEDLVPLVNRNSINI